MRGGCCMYRAYENPQNIDDSIITTSNLYKHDYSVYKDSGTIEDIDSDETD